MSTQAWLVGFQYAVLIYLCAINAGYLLLNLAAVIRLRRSKQDQASNEPSLLYADLVPPISVLVPAYNEQATIVASVRSMLQLDYPQFEVIVINDGSRDDTLQTLAEAFRLRAVPGAYATALVTEPVRTVYQSLQHSNLRVIDKANGGKADALNAGINAALYPLFCGVDADSILQRDSLQNIVRPFLDLPDVVAAGGTVRIANGCVVKDGFLKAVDVPRSWLARFQVIEYLRAFLFGRLGWSALNGMLIISGAFGLFRKDTVIRVGGYTRGCIGEDMELVVRMHRLLRLWRVPYRIEFVADPICWTEAPEDLATLKNQRVRWQRGLAESLTANLGLLCHPRGGVPGWVAFPFFLLFEWLGPLLEVAGFAVFLMAWAAGLLSAPAVLTFLLLSLSLGLLLSASGILLEEMSFPVYGKPHQLAILLLTMLLENLGYRQLNTLWRLWGLMLWATRSQARWGEMRRHGHWQQSPASPEPPQKDTTP